MEGLNLSTFIKAADDVELSKYKFLSILGSYTNALHKNKLYPSLAELISIKNELELLVEQMSLFDPEFVLNLNFADFTEEAWENVPEVARMRFFEEMIKSKESDDSEETEEE